MATIPKIKIGSTGRSSSLEDGAYEYLCRLEEAKQWIEHMLGENLPPVTELEDALQNGVILCKLGMKLLPGDPLWKKVYDLDLEKFKARGLDYRYTDNINFWLASLQKIGLPKVFYPVMTDIYHKKNIPKLIYCLHALSHLLRKKGKASQAVGDLYGTIEFPQEALVQTTQTLKTRTRDMPVFGVVENLVDEELQYQAMGLSDSAEEETCPGSPSDIRRAATPEEMEPLFDDPKYWTTKSTSRKAVTNGSDKDTANKELALVACEGAGVRVSLYAIKEDGKEKKSTSMTPFDSLLVELNELLTNEKPDETLKVLQNPDGNFPFVYNEPVKYYRRLLRETKEGIPGNVLPVFHGIDREMCDAMLEKMNAGAFIVRSSITVKGAYVISFRNQTGIKHWKLSTKHNKFYWGTSSLYSSLEDFVQHFIEALAKVTKLRIFQGMTTALHPVFASPEHHSMMGSLRESHPSLTYGQICKVIKEVNTEIRQGRKSSFSEQHSQAVSINEKQWTISMLVKVNRVEAEKILMKDGKPGSYLVRPSERKLGDYALAFRTSAEMRHWRIVQENGKFYVHPRPNPYDTLEDIVQHFTDAVGAETGLTMAPLECATSTQPVGNKTSETSGMNTLSPWTPTSPQRNSVVPSQSLSKLNPANLTSWSVDDVCYWLTQQGLGKFIDIFKANAVDGDCLLMLDNNLLKEDLGITALGHRSRILKRVKTLKESVHPQLQ